VPESVKTAADLKGKRLSAAGGVGGFNWVVGRAVLRTAGLTVDRRRNSSRKAQPGACPVPRRPDRGRAAASGRHAHRVCKKPGAHVLIMLSDLEPKFSFNHYGASDALIAKDRPLLVDTIAAMIEANRAIYRDKAKVLPIIIEATQKPKEAVDYAIDVITKGCMLSVKRRLRARAHEWTHQNSIDIATSSPPRNLLSSRSSTCRSRATPSRRPAGASPSGIARINPPVSRAQRSTAWWCAAHPGPHKAPHP